MSSFNLRSYQGGVPVWLVPSLVLVALLSLFSLFTRHQVEASNKAVALAAEYEHVEALAAAQGMGTAEALQKLKAQGLSALALNEETIGDLIIQGKVSLENQVWDGEQESPKVRSTALIFHDPTAMARVQRGLRIRLRELVSTLTPRENVVVLPPVSPSLIRSVSIGLSPEQTDVATDGSMMIIGRFANPGGTSSAAVRETLSWAKEDGVQVFLPLGDQVLGRRDALEATEEALEQLGILYASPEFTKLGGDANLVKAAPHNLIRLHAAQVAELDKMSLEDAVERYGKAARERNMRILLLRPISFASDQPLADFGTFVKAVTDQIRSEGGDIGKPRPFKSPNMPRFWPVLIALAAAPGLWFAASSLFGSVRVRRVLAAAFALLALATVLRTALHLDTLLISLFFPLAGFALLDALRPKNVIAGFLIVSLVSLVGGLAIAGMLNGLPYYMGADEFRGVKLSVFLPVLLVGILFAMRLVDWRAFLKSPITWGTAALGMVVLFALLMMVARSGNDSGAGASDTELAFRGVLDRVLYVRPRTKEFLIGHPILVVAVGMLSFYSIQRQRVEPEPSPGAETRSSALGGWTALLLMVGAMGQTSIVNTLTHLHIPVTLSLARIGIGMVVGCTIGMVLWALVSRLLPRTET